MAWHAIGKQPDTFASSGTDWTRKLKDCDPYLVWSDATGGEVSAATCGPEKLPLVQVLIELPTSADDATARRRLNPLRDALGPAFELSHVRLYFGVRFLTGGLPLDDVHKLVDLVGGQIVRFTVMAHRHRERRAVAPADGLRSAISGQGAGSTWLNTQPKAHPLGGGVPPAPPALPALLGIIDDGCPVGNELFWPDAGRPAIVRLWHQGRGEAPANTSPSDACADGSHTQHAAYPDWRDPAIRVHLNPIPLIINTFHYGDELALDELARSDAASRAAGPDKLPLFGPQSHRRIGYPRRPPHWTHGAAVLGLAAGDKRPLLAEDCQHAPRRRMADRPIVFVQLPETKVEETSFGSLAGHVLDGIHYILSHADPKQHVVVNLSYGHHAGPHDGTSMFEQGVEELLERHPLLHVVVAAGNSHLARCHARSAVPPGQTRRLNWRVLPDNPEDSFLELWLDGDARAVTVTLVPPGGSQGEVLSVSHDEARSWVHSPSGTLRCAAIFAPSVAQGRNGTMVLIAVAATQRVPQDTGQPGDLRLFSRVTQRARRALEGVAGVWRVEVRNAGTASVDLHAWVERDEVAPGRSFRGRSVGRQSYLLDDDDDPLAVPVAPTSTLNGIATLQHCRYHVIGAMNARDGSLSDYSTAGPTRLGGRVHGPTLVTLGDESRALPGLRSPGQGSGATARVGGTSIAAAVFSQMLAADPDKPFFRKPHYPPTPDRPRFPTDPLLAPSLLRGDSERVFPPGLEPERHHQR
jgi:hypothetical protein